MHKTEAMCDHGRAGPPEAAGYAAAMATNGDMNRADVLIAGAGLNGLTAALLLAEAGATVLVVDPTPRERLAHPDYDWRTTAIAQGAMRILERVGAWDRAWSGGAIRHIRIVDGASPLFLHYDGGWLDEGDLGCIVPNANLRRRLFEAADADARIQMALGVGVETADRTADQVAARLTDGGRVSARLLVGADGRGSPTRKAAGIDERVHDYGQTAIVATAAHAEPHGGSAHERFLPSGPFAILPLPDAGPDDPEALWPHRSSIVWTDKSEMAARMLELARPDLDRELARRFGAQFGELASVGPIGSFPLRLTLSTRMTDRRLALVGDAARAIHPIAGQGFNLGLRDSAELAGQVGDRLALGLDPGAPDLLAAYAAARTVDAAGLTAATHAINRLFSNDMPPLELARRLGLAAVEATPPLKRFFMRHAMGLAGRSATLAGDGPISQDR